MFGQARATDLVPCVGSLADTDCGGVSDCCAFGPGGFGWRSVGRKADGWVDGREQPLSAWASATVWLGAATATVLGETRETRRTAYLGERWTREAVFGDN